MCGGYKNNKFFESRKPNGPSVNDHVRRVLACVCAKNTRRADVVTCRLPRSLSHGAPHGMYRTPARSVFFRRVVHRLRSSARGTSSLYFCCCPVCLLNGAQCLSGLLYILSSPPGPPGERRCSLPLALQRRRPASADTLTRRRIGHGCEEASVAGRDSRPAGPPVGPCGDGTNWPLLLSPPRRPWARGVLYVVRRATGRPVGRPVSGWRAGARVTTHGNEITHP